MTNETVFDQTGIILEETARALEDQGVTITIDFRLTSVQPYEALFFEAATMLTTCCANTEDKVNWKITGGSHEIEKLIVAYDDLRTTVIDFSLTEFPTGSQPTRSLLQQARFKCRREMGKLIVTQAIELANGDDGDEAAAGAFTYENEKGKLYFLNARIVEKKDGTTSQTYYFASEPKANPVAMLPADMYVSLLPNGLPILKRIAADA